MGSPGGIVISWDERLTDVEESHEGDYTLVSELNTEKVLIGDLWEFMSLIGLGIGFLCGKS